MPIRDRTITPLEVFMLFTSQTGSETNSSQTPPNRQSPPLLDIIPSKVVLSVSVAPLLLGLWGGKALATLLKEIGEASEEVFRGDRLPVLNFPSDKAPETPLERS